MELKHRVPQAPNLSRPATKAAREPGERTGKSSSSNSTFWWLLLFHFVLACLTLTYFQPDETWQSVEVAHRAVFGYGYLTWEWQVDDAAGHLPWSRLLVAPFNHAWRQLSHGPLRSALHPFLFAPAFMLLEAVGLDNPRLLILVPRLCQGALSAVGCYYTARLAREMSGGKVADATLLSMLTSPYYLFTACRTFSNTAEASVTAVGLFYWFRYRSRQQMCKSNGSLWAAVISAAVACLLRPTNATVWLGLYSEALWQMMFLPKQLLRLSLVSALVACVALTTSTTLLDSAFFGRAALPMIPFLIRNVYHSVSIFYGSHPWHWYLSQGLPVILMLSLPFSLKGAVVFWKESPHGRLIVGICVWMIAVFSLLSHKEWRFLQPLLPMLHTLSGRALARSSEGSSRHSQSLLARIWASTSRRNAFFLSSGLPLAVYLLLFHCVGQGWTLPLYIHEQTKSGEIQTVGFLMPCHSTPWQSHFHLPGLEVGLSAQAGAHDSDGSNGNANVRSNGSGDWGKMWFLTCEPPKPGQDLVTYLDQSDHFYANPVEYLQLYFPSEVDRSFPPSQQWTAVNAAAWDLKQCNHFHSWPSHIVVFDALLQHAEYGAAVVDLFQEKGYRIERRIWNSLFHDDDRRRGDIVIWRHDA